MKEPNLIHDYFVSIGRKGGVKVKKTKPKDYFKKLSLMGHRARWGWGVDKFHAKRLDRKKTGSILGT